MVNLKQLFKPKNNKYIKSKLIIIMAFALPKDSFMEANTINLHSMVVMEITMQVSC